MKTHMKMVHTAEAAYHTKCAKLCADRGDDEMGKLHLDHAEHHVACAKEVMSTVETNEHSGDELKISDAELLKRFGINSSAVMPLAVSSVAPSDEALQRTAGAHKMVSRAGQEMQVEKADSILNEAFPTAFEEN